MKKPLVGNYLDSYLCVYMTKKMVDQEESAILIADRWRTMINQKLLRLAFIADIEFLNIVNIDDYTCAKEERSK